MSSPITFSGFNNIDFNVVLNAIMQQASQPMVALQNRQTAIRSQVTTFDLFSNRVQTLRSAADAIASLTTVEGTKGTSSDATAVSVSTTSSAVSGAHEVIVNTLARAQVTASVSTSPDATTTAVASGGTLSINGVDVTLTGDTTLQGLANAINATDDVGVTASVVRTGTTAYKLVLTSTDTGLANAFTLTNNLTGGTGVTFTDTDLDGTSGDSEEDNAVDASDASLLVNNIPVTGSSNVFADVLPGVTLTALKEDPTQTIRIEIGADSSQIKTKVTAFVTAYNDLVKFINEQRKSANDGEAASIGRDPVLRQLHNTLRTELMAAHGASAFTRLSEVGIEFTITGTIELDEDRLAEAVAEDPDAVTDLFTGTDGAFDDVKTILVDYAAAGGFISDIKERLNEQISSMETQIGEMQSRLAMQREALLKEFIAADQAISRLQNASGALGNLGNLYRQF